MSVYRDMRLLAAACLLVVSLPALAQGKATTFLLEDTAVAAGTGGQFEPLQQQYCAATVRAGAPYCLVFSTAVFGDANRYLTLLPFNGFAHFDAGKYAENGLTVEEYHALTGPPAAQTHQSAIALEPEVSYSHTNNTNRPLNLFVEFQLRPGAVDAFMGLVRTTWLPMARKAGCPAFEVFRTIVGGSPDRVYVVTRLDSFQQLDHYGYGRPESLAWEDFMVKNVSYSHSFVMRYRPDVSANPNDPAP